MNRLPWLLSFALMLGCATSHPQLLDGSRLIDLSHAFDSDTIFWPTEKEGFVLERGPAGMTEQGYWYEANRFRSAEHGGTHLDAPAHFAQGRQTVDEIPVEHLAGGAVVVDVSRLCELDPDYKITVEDFEGWESQYGPIQTGAIVLLHTGFAKVWPDRVRYLGTDLRGPEAVPHLHFPGLSEQAAHWLVHGRKIKAVGIDTASIDPGQSTVFGAHRALFAADVPAFENLRGLDQLPARDFTVIALPMNIRGGSGAPLRALAVVPH